MRTPAVLLAAISILSPAWISTHAQQAAAGQQGSCGAVPCPYLNPALAPEARAKDIVSRMTIEEKVSQMQDVAPAIPRLGVTAYNWWNEALHGVARNGFATNFPQSIGLAASWDTALMHHIATVIAVEGRAKYNEAIRNDDRIRFAGLTFWSPNINIFRDPRWGRGMETFGEDPFLTASLGVEFVKGLQGDDPHYLELVATPKHFAVHSGPEPLRHGFNVNVSDHDLEDTYLPAFRAAIVVGHADSIMCAYNAIDGAPACANSMLLQQHLRQDWGFNGYVVSDCDAVADIERGHHYATSPAQGDADAVRAGTDLDCGSAYNALTKAVAENLVSVAEIDTAVTRLFTARMRLGMFDPPASVPFNAIPYSEVDSAAHRELALEAARESIVLLKNRNRTLPLRPSIRKLAVVGPTADLLESIEGNYNGTASHPISPLDGMRRQFGTRQHSLCSGIDPRGRHARTRSIGILAHGCLAPDRGIERRVLRQSAICGHAKNGAHRRQDQFRLEPRGAGSGLFRDGILRAMDGQVSAARSRRLRVGYARAAPVHGGCCQWTECSVTAASRSHPALC